MPKQVKFTDAVKKNPQAFDEVYQTVKTGGKWKDDLDNEKNLKESYKQMTPEQKQIIDEIFKKYKLTVVLKGGRNFTILEDDTHTVERVTKELQSFENTETPNTTKMEELEKEIQTLKGQRDPLIKQSTEQDAKIKQLETQLNELKGIRLKKWSQMVFEFFEKAVLKVMEKPAQWTLSAVGIYVFYKLCQATVYVGNLFQTGLDSISKQWNGESLVDAINKTLSNNTNTSNRTALTPYIPPSQALVEVAQRTERVVTHTIETVATTMAVITGILATATFLSLMGTLFFCYKMKTKGDKPQELIRVLNAQNEIVGTIEPTRDVQRQLDVMTEQPARQVQPIEEDDRAFNEAMDFFNE